MASSSVIPRALRGILLLLCFNLLCVTLVISTHGENSDQSSDEDDDWENVDRFPTLTEVLNYNDSCKAEFAVSAEDYRLPLLDYFTNRFSVCKVLNLRFPGLQRVMYLSDNKQVMIHETQVKSVPSDINQIPHTLLIITVPRNYFLQIKPEHHPREMSTDMIGTLMVYDQEHPAGVDWLKTSEGATVFLDMFAPLFYESEPSGQACRIM